MKASELRIGNLVEAPLGEIMTVTILGSNENPYYIHAEYEFGSGINGFKPIPITEEWLVNLGFEKDGDLGWHCIKYTIGGDMIPDEIYKMSINAESQRCAISMYGYIDAPFKKKQPSNYSSVQYVHTLQNLYFALTGEELKLKQ